MQDEKLPFISVIVPVYNSAQTLPRLFKSLMQLDYDRQSFEILLVDNGSTDRSLHELNNFIECFSGNGSVYVEDRKVGSYAARNRALVEAKGDIIAFTDADCEVRRDWLKEIQRELTIRGRRAVIGGRVDLKAEVGEAPNAVEMYEMVLGFSQQSNVTVHGFSVTANLAAWKDAFEAIGIFAELKSKGDFEWCRRASAEEFEIHYAENVVVEHPARNSIRDLVTKSRRVTGGQFDLRRLGTGGGQRTSSKKSAFALFLTVIRNREFPRCHQKASILMVASIVMVVKAGELIRLKQGGKSERC